MSNINLQPHVTRLGGKDYVMVSGRVLLAHEDNPDTLSVETSIESITDEWVIVRATVTTRKGTFTGHAVSSLKSGSPQEKKTPVEVAETSAVGRALGFAGYAIEGGIASADEMQKGGDNAPQEPVQASREQINEILALCAEKGTPLSTICDFYKVPGLQQMTGAQAAHAIGRLQRKQLPAE